MIPATLEEVSALGPALLGFIGEQLTPPARMAVELGVIEALVNVAKHAFPGGTPGVIHVSCRRKVDRLVIEIRDNGSSWEAGPELSANASVFEFDPGNIEALPEGGMGLELIRSSFDTVSYSRKGAANCLELTKLISSAS